MASKTNGLIFWWGWKGVCVGGGRKKDEEGKKEKDGEKGGDDCFPGDVGWGGGRGLGVGE